MARRVRKVGMTVRRGSDLEDWAKDAKRIKVVKKDGKPIGVITWHGGHTLNFFNTQGKNVDMQNVGDFANNSITEEEAKKYMDSYARNIVKHPENHDYTLYE